MRILSLNWFVDSHWLKGGNYIWRKLHCLIQYIFHFQGLERLFRYELCYKNYSQLWHAHSSVRHMTQNFTSEKTQEVKDSFKEDIFPGTGRTVSQSVEKILLNFITRSLYRFVRQLKSKSTRKNIAVNNNIRECRAHRNEIWISLAMSRPLSHTCFTYGGLLYSFCIETQSIRR